MNRFLSTTVLLLMMASQLVAQNEDRAELRVYRLQTVQADVAAKLLVELIQDIKNIAADPHQNSVIVRASSKQHEVVEAILKQMDTPKEDANNTTRFYAVRHSDASSIAQVIEHLFADRYSTAVRNRLESRRQRFLLRPL